MLAASLFPSCWMMRAYKVRKMRLTDHEKLASVTIHKSETPFHFIEATEKNQLANLLDTVLPQSQTAAFLVIRHDSVIYERYFKGFDNLSLLPSNSMAKSFVGTLVSIAHEEGKIRSFTDPITDYLPELLLRDSNFAKITLQYLLDMRSGLDYTEGIYNLKDDGVRLGLRPNIVKHILKIRIAEPPGRFKYQSVNTMLLGLVIERTCSKKLPEYLEEKIWKPLGMESEATWNVDSKKRKHVIASSAINAVARDFAKLGRLYLKGGIWNGNRILDAAWVSSIASIDTMNRYGGYKDQWWSRRLVRNFTDSATALQFQHQNRFSDDVKNIDGKYRVAFRTDAFNASGFLNQIIYVNPVRDLIIVRLGQRWSGSQDFNQFIYSLGLNL